MNNQLFLTKLSCWKTGVSRIVGIISLLVLTGGALVVTSCGRKSQAEEDEANLKLVGYDLDQAGFFKAVANDDVPSLQIFEERGFDLLQKDHLGRSAVYVAAESGSEMAMHFFAKSGANIEEADGEGVTPLMAAARAGGSENAEVITYLLGKGANAMQKDKIGKFALIHAMDAGSMESVHLIAPRTQQLLDTGLLYAADLDHHETIPVLVKYGASVYARNSGKTSLMIAAERGNEKSVRVLIDEGANIYAVSDEGKLAKDYAEGNEKVLAVLLDSEVDTSNEALAMEWSEEELEDLVQKAKERTEVENVTANDAGEDVASEVVKIEIPNQKVTIERIRGKNLPLELGDDVAVEKEMTMAVYAEKSLPLKVKSDDRGKIHIQDLREGKAAAEREVSVVEGSQIGMTGLRVKQIKKKIVNNKLTGGYDKELVTLVIENGKSGEERELYVGEESQLADGVAVIRMKGSGGYLILERGDDFYDLSGKAYKVMDVNDEEVIIENIATGKQSLLPLMGVKR